MTIVAEFSVPVDSHPLGSALTVPPRLDVEVHTSVPFGEDFAPFLWVEGKEELADRFESRLRENRAVSSVRRLDTATERRLYRIDWERPAQSGLMKHFSADGLTIERAIAADGAWTFRVLSRERDIGEVRELVFDRDLPMTVHRVLSTVPAEPDTEQPDVSLTAVQRRTLRLALERGYFEIPREITLEELGAEFGITRQSVSSRLTRGLRELVAGHCPPREVGRL